MPGWVVWGCGSPYVECGMNKMVIGAEGCCTVGGDVVENGFPGLWCYEVIKLYFFKKKLVNHGEM